VLFEAFLPSGATAKDDLSCDWFFFKVVWIAISKDL
jgi:hypothetical protein